MERCQLMLPPVTISNWLRNMVNDEYQMYEDSQCKVNV